MPDDVMPLEHLVLRRLAGLPLLTDTELSKICQVALPGVREGLRRLRQRGWLFERTLSDPAVPDHVYALSDRAITVLRDDPDQAERALGPLPWWACTTESIARAVASAPSTRGNNRVIAALAESIRQERTGLLTWGAPPPTPRARKDYPDPMHPPISWGAVEVRWRAGGREARLAFHYDPPTTPMARRVSLLSLWQRRMQRAAREAATTPVIVICERRSDIRIWATAFERLVRQHGSSQMPRVLISTPREVGESFGLTVPFWRSPARTSRVALTDFALWLNAPDPETDAVPTMARVPPPATLPRIGHQSDAQSALERPRGRMSRARTVAQGALTLDIASHRVAGWLAVQPWLSPDDVAHIEGVTSAAAQRRLDALREAGFARPSGDGYWALTSGGLHLAAARGGMLQAIRAYRNATLTVWTDGHVPSAPPHDAGISRCLGILAQPELHAGWRLAEWVGERRWTQEFSPRQPVPDAAFVMRHEGEAVSGLLEHEHAVPGGDYWRTKLDPWAQWYRSGMWRRYFDRLPVLVFVYGDGLSPSSLIEAIRHLPEDVPAGVAALDSFAASGPVISNSSVVGSVRKVSPSPVAS